VIWQANVAWGYPFGQMGTAHGSRHCSGLALPPSDAAGHRGNGVADGSTSQVSPRPLHAVGGRSADWRTLSRRRELGKLGRSQSAATKTPKWPETGGMVS
jgi:hypothetical protein